MVMKLDKNTILPQLNLCYINFDKNWDWGISPDEAAVQRFAEHILEDAGLQMIFEFSMVNDVGKYGWKITQLDLVDEQKFTLWMLRWS
jgi:hypothetical protein